MNWLHLKLLPSSALADLPPYLLGETVVIVAKTDRGPVWSEGEARVVLQAAKAGHVWATPWRKPATLNLQLYDTVPPAGQLLLVTDGDAATRLAHFDHSVGLVGIFGGRLDLGDPGARKFWTRLPKPNHLPPPWGTPR